MTNPNSTRRTFLRSAAVASVATALGATNRAAAAARSSLVPGEDWDFRWLDRLTGQHRQVFDVGWLEPEHPFTLSVRNYFNAFRDVYHQAHPEVNAVVVVASGGHPVVFDDATWRKYGFGRAEKVKDPRTRQWSTRNIYAAFDASTKFTDANVADLQARGAVFLMCNNALRAIASRLAAEHRMPVETVRDELIRGFLPGVVLVPAATMAVGLAQERGCTYQAV